MWQWEVLWNIKWRFLARNIINDGFSIANFDCQRVPYFFFVDHH